MAIRHSLMVATISDAEKTDNQNKIYQLRHNSTRETLLMYFSFLQQKVCQAQYPCGLQTFKRRDYYVNLSQTAHKASYQLR